MSSGTVVLLLIKVVGIILLGMESTIYLVSWYGKYKTSDIYRHHANLITAKNTGDAYKEAYADANYRGIEIISVDVSPLKLVTDGTFVNIKGDAAWC